ncbi:hypothetical protein GW17_00052885 [Ensete ventricosum]|nr:hypothetical protein GW17_00052885 [Ensete ventricosum]
MEAKSRSCVGRESKESREPAEPSNSVGGGRSCSCRKVRQRHSAAPLGSRLTPLRCLPNERGVDQNCLSFQTLKTERERRVGEARRNEGCGSPTFLVLRLHFRALSLGIPEEGVGVFLISSISSPT